MRDNRYIAVHRGGPLTSERHRLLAVWAADCAEHLLPLFRAQRPEDNRPALAIEAARAWARGEITVGTARDAAVAAHAAARDAGEGAACFVARASGHAVATGAAIYVIKAIRAASNPADTESAVAEEHRWQIEQLPAEIRELVLSTFEEKFAFMRLPSQR